MLPGVLTQTDFAHPDRAFSGGPVGELTQWADLIAALYLLGHELDLRWDIHFAGIEYVNILINCLSNLNYYFSLSFCSEQLAFKVFC